MSGISDKAIKSNYAENKFRFSDKELQNKEFSDGSGLEEYDFGARFYDQQIGRFFTQDRFADYYYSLTPYQYTANSPTNFVDENGDYITIDKKDDNGNVMLSLLYDGGKAYFYSKDKDGNITKGDAWDGKDGFIQQTVTDLNDVSSTKQEGTVVGDLEGSKYGYNISEASGIPGTGFQSDDGAKGGGSIAYTQKGGTVNGVSANNSAVVLGHELYHGWASEFTNESKGTDFGQRLLREKGAVKFENYLRASFGEKDMRTDYSLQGNTERVASSSVEEAKAYQLPRANYLKFVPIINIERHLQHDVDATYVRPPIVPLKTIDTRKQKF